MFFFVVFFFELDGSPENVRQAKVKTHPDS